MDKKETIELVKIVQSKEHPEKDLAFNALINRFWIDILGKCEIVCGRYGYGVDVSEEIAQNVFQSYYKKGNFTIENSTVKSIDHAFKIYLYGFARNELTNYYRAKTKQIQGKDYSGCEEIITDLPSNINLDNMSDENKVIYSVIQNLPKHLKTVYLTYKTHEKTGVNLPKELQSKLREYLGGIKQGTVRTYNKEAHDRIEQALVGFKLASKNKYENSEY